VRAYKGKGPQQGRRFGEAMRIDPKTPAGGRGKWAAKKMPFPPPKEKSPGLLPLREGRPVGKLSLPGKGKNRLWEKNLNPEDTFPQEA